VSRGPAILVLKDGTVFRGVSIGAEGLAVGEVVFNTAITGYQEILTDPSYCRQIVTLTYPHIGNTGANPVDVESERIYASGLVIRDLPLLSSNWRKQWTLSDYLKQHGVVAISDIDTRRLTRILRDGGAQDGCLMAGKVNEKEALAAARGFPGLVGMDLARVVSCEKPYAWDESVWSLGAGYGRLADPRFHVVAFDFGVKRNILRRLVDQGFDVTVVPSRTSAAEVRALAPDAVFLSNGPGDPAAVQGIREAVRSLADDYPIFGICLGHQILGLALGGATKKLKFGHHGGNQPGKDLATGRVAICAENHGYAVDADSLRRAGEPVEITHVNLNDDTVEGLAHARRPLFSVQYHPEASPGPHDVDYFFSRFREMTLRHKRGERVSGAQIAKGN
jgi:carbamoyl-phosphate synthase small subunit